ncbi:hypothetical protein [Salinisphaera sp. C84B14]
MALDVPKPNDKTDMKSNRFKNTANRAFDAAWRWREGDWRG